MLLKIEVLFIPLLANSHIFEISEDDHSRLVTHARDHWWTLDFANASLSPGVNSRVEVELSPRANARNGAPRRWHGDEEMVVQYCLMHTDRSFREILATDGRLVLS
jgi:hypothetical protein